MTSKLVASIALMIAITLSVALAKDPHKVPNNSRGSLSGNAATDGVSSFEMDYGEGKGTVEMEEDVRPTSLESGLIANRLKLRGTIVAIDGRKCTIDTGKRKVEIDTIEMFYNPLDDKGYQKIKIGDYVQVTGKLTSNDMKKADLIAETITTLTKDKNKPINDK